MSFSQNLIGNKTLTPLEQTQLEERVNKEIVEMCVNTFFEHISLEEAKEFESFVEAHQNDLEAIIAEMRSMKPDIDKYIQEAFEEYQEKFKK